MIQVRVCLTEKDFIGLDKSGQRLLLLSADSDVDKVAVRISHLKRSAWLILFHTVEMFVCVNLQMIKNAVVSFVVI